MTVAYFLGYLLKAVITVAFIGAAVFAARYGWTRAGRRSNSSDRIPPRT